MAIVDQIEDDALKAEITQLGLTLPDPQSVLNPAIETAHAQLYYKLVAMEAYTYQASQQQATAVEYMPFWQPYNDALMAYVNHAPVPKQKLKDFIIGFYCFISVHKGRGEGDPALIPQSDAKKIFNFGGYYEDTVANWPLNHFDDYMEGDPAALPEPTEDSAETLTAAPEEVEPLWDKDAAKVAALTAQFADVVSDAGMNAAFSAPTPPQDSLSTTEVWDLIFDELNWQWYITTNGSAVKIPPRP